jgi:hypothetical protein
MSGKPLTPEELLAAIAAIPFDADADEVDRMSDEEIDAEISAEGGDPIAMGARGAKLAEKLIDRRKRLAWQVEANEALDAAKGAATKLLAAEADRRAKMTRSEIIEEIKRAEREGFGVGLAARKGGAEEATEEQLRELLEQIVMLRGVKGRAPG